MLSIILSGKNSHQMATTLTKLAHPSTLVIYFLCFISIRLSQQECVKKSSIPGGTSSNTNTKPLSNFQVSTSINNTEQYTLSKSSPVRFSYFTITLGFMPPSNSFQVAPVISTMEGYNDDTGIDFSIRISKNTDSFDVIFVMNDKAAWQNIKMNFIVEARQDIRAGTFVADTAPFMMPKVAGKTIVVQHCLQETWRIQNKYMKVQPFITGLKIQDRNFKLTFGSSKFIKQQNKVSIQIQFNSSSQPLELMFVSYVIFVVDSTFQANKIPDLLNLPSNKLFFVGMSSKNQTISPLQNVRTLSTPIGKTFNNKGIIIQFQNLVEVNWLSNDSMSQFFKGLSSKNQCITIQYCKELGGFFTWRINPLSLQSYFCQFCGENQTFSYSNQKCQCLVGYSRNFTGSCSLPPKPSRNLLKSSNGNLDANSSCRFKINNKCYILGGTNLEFNCPQNSVRTAKGECECIQNFLYDVAINGCILNPCRDPSAVYINGHCVCSNPEQNYIGGLCKKCELNKIWDKQLNGCICKQNTIKVGLACRPCHPDAIPNRDKNQCKCKAGFKGNGFICRKIS